jgi:hypothetical protein
VTPPRVAEWPACKSCFNPLSKSAVRRGAKTGLCGNCYHASIRVDRRCSECGKAITFKARQGRCQPCANRHMAQDAHREARRLNLMRQALARPEVRARKAAANRRASARRLAWLPQDRRAQYFKMVKRMPAAEARRAIFAQMTPFERQVARVLAGEARVVAKWSPPSPTPGFSAFGSAAAMMEECA